MLHVHRAASGRDLVRALAEVLAHPPADPFAADVVAVPAKGVERWLSQRLGHHLGAGPSGDGVCARVEFPRPGAVLDDALSAASPGYAAAAEAWAADVLTWRLLDLLDHLPNDDRYAPVRHHLAGGPNRRYALAAKTAGLLDRYGRERPELLPCWEGVQDELRWQEGLWRSARELLGPSPTELLADAVAALRAAPARGRVCLYGPSRLTSARLQALAALAHTSEVHLFVHHPGPAVWDADPPEHPLLASLAQDVIHLKRRLLAAVPDLVTTVHDTETGRATLLGRLQHDLRTGATPTDPAPVAAGDRTVQVHACHGPARQVEVLREVLLHLLAGGVEPREVIVMCPDVERYAPLVAAAFDTDTHPGGRVRVAIADRSPVQTNPMLALAARLLDLADSRVGAAAVLDLAGLPAVRVQFAFTDDDLERIRVWTAASHVRWGLDGAARAAWDLGGLQDGTWRRGIDRVLAGIALGASETPIGGLLPVGGIESTAIDLVGRFAEFVDRVHAAVSDLQAPRPATGWTASLEKWVLDLGGHGRHEAWQAEQLGRELDDVSLAAAGSTGLMTLTDLRILLARRLAGRPTRTSFRTGALTLCTLTPMRSVPHKVICLLGMDDAAFPRHGLPDGDDFLARSPRDGERDPRREDRQLFLDALLAAEHTLVVTYSGFDVRTGVRLPPAVPVGELLDALELTAPGARQHVVVEHPLQPFDPRNFTPGDLGEPGPLSFDRQACDGAHALRTAGTARVPFLTAPLAPPAGDEGVVALNTLREFWQHPAKGFLRQRLGVDSTTAEDEPSDALLLELTGLQAWAVGDRLLRLRMGGTPGAQARAAESARGALPPAVFGDDLLNGIDAEVTALAQACSTYWAAPTPLEFDLPVSGSATLNGTVVFRGGQILSVGYSKLGPKPRLRAWLDLLAAAVATGRPTSAVVIGRGSKPDAPAVETYHVNDPDVASDLLADLLRVRQIGMCTPLALPLKAGEAYARARSTGSGSVEAREKSARKWEGGFDYAGEDAEAEHRLVWGPDATFDVLTGWSCPLPLELPGDEHGDFARLASWLWAPILAAEVTS